MTQANLQEYAHKQGIDKKIQSMDQQSQVMLRYSYVMDSMRIAQGNFSRESQGWAAQTKILGEQWKEFLIIIGNGLTKVMLPVLQFINKAMRYLISFANVAGQAIAKIFGLKKSARQTSNAIAPINSSMVDLGSKGVKGMDNLGKATENAGKKAKGALAGFDDLNVLSQGIGDIDPARGGNGDVVSGLSIPLPDMGYLDESLVNDYTSSIEAFFGKIGESLRRLWESASPIIEKLGNVIGWLNKNILTPFFNWFTKKILPVGLDILSKVLEDISPILDSVGKLGKWMWDNFLKPIASWTGGVIVDTLKLLSDVLGKIGNWMRDNQPIVDAITFSVVSFFAAWEVAKILSFIEQSGGLISVLGRIGEAIKNVTLLKLADKLETVKLTAMYAIDFLKSIASTTKALIVNTVKWGLSTAAKIADTVATTAATTATWLFNAALAVLTSPITLVAGAIAALIAIVVLLVKNWDTVKEAGAKAWEWIKKIWHQAVDWFFKSVVDPISRLFSGMWNNIKDTAANAWEGILSLFSKGGHVFKGIVDGVSGVFIKAVNWLLSGINTVIAMPLNIVNDILNWISDISIMGFKPFSFIGHNPIPVPQIPYLDVGTNYVAKDGLAVIHEGEAVVPKKYNPAIGGNLEQIKLLEEQNRLLKALLEKDNDVYLDGDSLHQANERRKREQIERLGYSF